MSGPILVTGATGFIGTRLVAQLTETDASVRVYVRDPDRLAPALRRRVEVVVGDMASPAALARAVQGADLVYHLAGLAAAWARRPASFHEVNVAGLRRLLRAVRRAGGPRVVHVSSVLTLFPPDPEDPLYVRSKRAGDRLVREYVVDGGDAVLAHPCRVYGPGPLNDANGATRLVRSFLRGPVPIQLQDGGVRASWVHVDDVARGLRLLAARGRRGYGYVLGGECCSVDELGRIVAEVSGRHRPVVRVPPGVALAAATVLEARGRLGLSVPITRRWVRSFLRDQTVDARPARALGFEPRPLRQGIAETVDWLIQREGGPHAAARA